MSFFGGLLVSVAGFVVSYALYVSYIVVAKIIRTRNAIKKFKKESIGIPLDDDYSLVGGNMIQMLMRAENCFRLDAKHKKFGPIFAWVYDEEPVVSTTDLDLIKNIALEDPQELDRFTYPSFPLDKIMETILTLPEDEWRKIRRIYAPAMSTMRLKAPNISAEFERNVDKCIKSIEFRLDKAKHEKDEDFVVINGEDIFLRYAMSTVFTCFYKQEDKIDYYVDSDPIVAMFHDGEKDMMGSLLALSLTLPHFRPVVEKLLHFTPYRKFLDMVINFITIQTKRNLEARKQIAEAKRKGIAIDEENLILKDGSKFQKSLIDFVIDKFHDGQISEKDYIRNTYFLFFAAGKTSTDAVGKLIYLLATHPDVQNKLRDEVIREGKESQYLMWCINEALRLFPANTMGCSRRVNREYQLNGYKIPAGTQVFTPVYTIQRMEEYWGQDAHEFKPERWEEAHKFHPAQYLVFGLGKRNCPGRDFAISEMKYLTEAWLKKFKFEYQSGPNDRMSFASLMYTFNLFAGPTYLKVSRL